VLPLIIEPYFNRPYSTHAYIKVGMAEAIPFLIVLPQLDTIISRILTYSQDFNLLERIVGDRLNEF
jgi:hypothetical protein